MSPPRRLAVLSDVHANLPALRAVVADADAAGAEELVLAGDVIGFGPEPEAVVDLLRDRKARMIRGNHEKDYLAVWGSPAAPAEWATGRRWTTFRWQMERLAGDRAAFLASLPDRLLIDEATLVVHGSPRHVRDAVLPWRTDEELEAMYAGDPSRVVFMGHTHRPHVRDLPARRLVNVGSVGMPLDSDPRAAYCLIEGGQAPGGWSVAERRVPYDVEAHLAAFDDVGLSEIDPGYVEIMRRQLRNAHDYFSPWLRYSRDLPDAELGAAMAAYLAQNP